MAGKPRRNLILLYPDRAEFCLSNGMRAIVDRQDLDLVRDYTWTAHSVGNAYYAVGGYKPQRSMHRIILPDAPEVDHINHNGLDNRRINLRSASRAENARNRAKQKTNSGKSPLKGVTLDNGRWRAVIYVNNKKISLGSFNSDIEAAKAYDTAARQHYGEYAKTNFGDEDEIKYSDSE